MTNNNVKDSNNHSPEHIVKMLVAMIKEGSSQELFSAIMENPGAVGKLDKEQIDEVILDPFRDKKTQLELKKALESLPAFQQLVKDMASYVNEFLPADGSIFSSTKDSLNTIKNTEVVAIQRKDRNIFFRFLSNFFTKKNTEVIDTPESDKSYVGTLHTADLSDVEDVGAGDIFKGHVSDLKKKSTSVDKQSDKLDLIDNFFYFLLTNISKYSAPVLEKFLMSLDKEQLQYSICADYGNLKEWEKKLLFEGIPYSKDSGANNTSSGSSSNIAIPSILKEYNHNVDVLSSKLKEKGIEDMTILHRNILDGLVESHQDGNYPDKTFYYFSGVNSNTLFVKFDVFSSTKDLDPGLQKNVGEYMAHHLGRGLLHKTVDKETENNIERDHKIEGEQLTADLIPYATKLLSNKEFKIYDLLPQQRNFPANLLKNNFGLAIPVNISHMDDTLKDNIYYSLFGEGNFEELEVPKSFDVGYLVRGSTINKTQQGSVDLSAGFKNTGDIYPVILYHGAAIILHDLSQFKKINDVSFLPDPDTTEKKANPIADILGEWIYNMVSNLSEKKYNHTKIYREIFERTKSSSKTSAKMIFDPDYKSHKRPPE